MESNPLHNAMIRYIHNKMLIIRALNPQTWYRFKQVEGIGLAENHTVTDLANIFRNEILPNIPNYDCVQQDPNIAFYMGHTGIVVPDIIPNQHPNVSNVNMFEAQRSYDNENATLANRSPIVTDDIISLSHAVSTNTENQRASLHSINESVTRLRYIQNERRSGADLHIPNLEDIEAHHKAVTAVHQLYGDVRLPDVMDKNPSKLTAQDRPLLLMDPNRPPQQGGSETQNQPIFENTRGDTSNTSLVLPHHSNVRDTVSNRSSVLPVNESVVETLEHGLPNFADLLPANMFICNDPIIIGRGFPDVFNVKRHQWPVLHENQGWEKLYPKVSGPIRATQQRRARVTGSRRDIPVSPVRPLRIPTDQATRRRSPDAQLSLPALPRVAHSTPLTSPAPATLTDQGTRRKSPTEQLSISVIPPAAHSTHLRSPAAHSTHLRSSAAHSISVIPPAAHSTHLRSSAAHSISVIPPAAHSTHLRSSATHSISVIPPAAHSTHLRSPAAHSISVIPPAAHFTPIRSRAPASDSSTRPPDYISPEPGTSGRPQEKTIYYGSEYSS